MLSCTVLIYNLENIEEQHSSMYYIYHYSQTNTTHYMVAVSFQMLLDVGINALGQMLFRLDAVTVGDSHQSQS